MDKAPWTGSFQAWTEYQLPFEFVAPSEIIPHNISRHPYRHEKICLERYQLPPSLGPNSRRLLRDKSLDDLAPFILFGCECSGNVTSTVGIEPIAECTHPVHIYRARSPEALFTVLEYRIIGRSTLIYLNLVIVGLDRVVTWWSTQWHHLMRHQPNFFPWSF